MGGMAHAVQTTLDIEMQTSVERMLLDRIGQLPPKVSMAVLVMDNSTLEIKAYAGSADFTDPDRAAHVDMVTGVRSPGSTLKLTGRPELAVAATAYGAPATTAPAGVVVVKVIV